MVKEKWIRQRMRKDIEFIQQSSSRKEFACLVKLFNTNYFDQVEFMNFFMKQWIEKLPNWFEGFSVNTLSTNNGLEATNKWIKDKQFRERLPLNEFLKCFMEIPNEWSIERSPGREKEYRETPDRPLSLWTYAKKCLV
jgi:hypothetical protein